MTATPSSARPTASKKEFIDRFVAEHEGWLTRAREKQQARRLAHPEPTDEERKALIARAKEYLPMRVDYWSGIMGLTPTGLKITSARTRFWLVQWEKQPLLFPGG